MKIFKQIAPLKSYLKGLKMSGKSIGLVPTMGALHRGHLALIEASKSQNEITVSSIFVNPTQFNNAADLSKYPRTLEKDTEMLKEVRCDVLFCPENDEIYPKASTVSFDFGAMDKVMEGQFRPGHFSGVALVVSKLFNIVKPDHAYFGQKDWQQFAILGQLVEQLNFDVALHSIPTMREPDGLALSSRNLRLTPEERPGANIFYRALTLGKERLLRGEKIPAVRTAIREMVEAQPGVRLEYFEVADRKNLNLLDNVEPADQAIICIAGFVGQVRLIDNLFPD